MYTRIPKRISADFSDSWQVKREYISKVLKGKNLQPKIFYPARLASGIKGEVRNFSDKQKLKQFINRKPTLKEMLKGLL